MGFRYVSQVEACQILPTIVKQIRIKNDQLFETDQVLSIILGPGTVQGTIRLKPRVPSDRVFFQRHVSAMKNCVDATMEQARVSLPCDGYVENVCA